jgi:hypothetical protein
MNEPLTEEQQRKKEAMAAHRAEWAAFFAEPDAGWTLH